LDNALDTSSFGFCFLIANISQCTDGVRGACYTWTCNPAFVWCHQSRSGTFSTYFTWVFLDLVTSGSPQDTKIPSKD